MTFYKEIEKIFPYLKSIRKLKTYLSFDVELPNSWKIPKKYTIEGKVVDQDKSNPGTRLISFVSDFNEDEIVLTTNNIKSIIDYNKELEEKEVLFVNKVEELKRIFEKQNLDKLQKLTFDIKEYKLTQEIDDDDEEQRDENPVASE
jgi:hypothetical protein